MFIIHLQAMYPDIKAVIKPIIRGKAGWSGAEISPDKIVMKLAPIMGTRTIRKENLVELSFETPNKSPADIVDPDLEIPGMMAITWASPIRIASV